MKLDVARIKHGHRKRDRSRLLLHTIIFHEPVESHDFYSGPGGLQLLFDIDKDPEEERAIKFELNPDGSVAAKIYKPGPRILGFANWWRPYDRAVKIEFPASLLARNLDSYRWRVLAAQSAPCDPPEPGGPNVDGCFDGTKRLTHEL